LVAAEDSFLSDFSARADDLLLELFMLLLERPDLALNDSGDDDEDEASALGATADLALDAFAPGALALFAFALADFLLSPPMLTWSRSFSTVGPTPAS